MWTSSTDGSIGSLIHVLSGILELYDVLVNDCTSANNVIVLRSYQNAEIRTYGKFEMKNCSFNRSFVGGWKDQGKYYFNSDMYIHDNTLEHNLVVDSSVGDIYVNCDNYIYENNITRGYYFKSEGANTKIEINCNNFVVRNNTRKYNASTGEWDYTAYTNTNKKFTANNGGDIYLNAKNMSICNNGFYRSDSDMGLALSVTNTSDIIFNVEKGEIKGNHMRTAIFFANPGHIEVSGDIDIEDITFYQQSHGGIARFIGASIGKLKSITIKNHKRIYDQAICIVDTSNVVFEDIKMINNVIDRVAMYVDGAGVKFTISGNNEFSNNTWMNETSESAFIRFGSGNMNFALKDGITKIYNNKATKRAVGSGLTQISGSLIYIQAMTRGFNIENVLLDIEGNELNRAGTGQVNQAIIKFADVLHQI